jgi:hypothetical protein
MAETEVAPDSRRKTPFRAAVVDPTVAGVWDFIFLRGRIGEARQMPEGFTAEADAD